MQNDEPKHVSVLVHEDKISAIKAGIDNAVGLLKDSAAIKALTYLLNEIEYAFNQVEAERKQQDRIKELETELAKVQEQYKVAYGKIREAWHAI